MTLAIRGIDGRIARGDTFRNDRQPDLKADYVLANPPFNDSDWRGDPVGAAPRGRPIPVAARLGQAQGPAPTLSLSDVVHRFKTMTT